MKITGVIEENNGIFCEKCSANLNYEGSTKFVMHIDSKDSYSNVFACTKCGNYITNEYERNSRDAQYWE